MYNEMRGLENLVERNFSRVDIRARQIILASFFYWLGKQTMSKQEHSNLQFRPLLFRSSDILEGSIDSIMAVV